MRAESQRAPDTAGSGSDNAKGLESSLPKSSYSARLEAYGSMGLGLRAQIIFALGAVFLLLFALLAVTAMQLTRRAGEVERLSSAKIIAQALAAAVDQLSDSKPVSTGPSGGAATAGMAVSSAALAAVAGKIVGRVSYKAVLIQLADGTVYRRGQAFYPPSVQVALARGGRVQLWLPESAPDSGSPLTNLLIFYVALTGGSVLLLTYVALTYWIVRPIEGLIQWAERLARSGERIAVPERGAAEVRRMAVAFSLMAEDLRAERVSLEERLRELERTTEELRAAQRQLVHGEKLATVGRLAAGVAHEIGNPLSAILGLVELLKNADQPEPERKEFLDRIYRETERIHRIIRDLLDFSRQGVESGELGLSSDLKRVVDDAVNLVKPLKEFRDIKIEINRPDILPRVVGPQHRLTQVVLNLLLNAADAMEGKGAVRIGITGPAETGGRVKLVIADSGPGIAPEVMDKLFEPFTTTKPVGKGTGLGLAVSYTLIDSLGGTLAASNAPEGGARFEVQLRISGSSIPPPRPEKGVVK